MGGPPSFGLGVGAGVQRSPQHNRTLFILWRGIAVLRRYSEASEWSFIFNVLAHYDLADLAASLAPLPQLVYQPTDANNKPLSPAAAAGVCVPPSPPSPQACAYNVPACCCCCCRRAAARARGVVKEVWTTVTPSTCCTLSLNNAVVWHSCTVQHVTPPPPPHHTHTHTHTQVQLHGGCVRGPRRWRQTPIGRRDRRLTWRQGQGTRLLPRQPLNRINAALSPQTAVALQTGQVRTRHAHTQCLLRAAPLRDRFLSAVPLALPDALGFFRIRWALSAK